MPMLRIANAGMMGANKDLSEHELPPGVWTDSSNVRFLDGYALQFYGHGKVYGTVPITPYHVFPIVNGTDRQWIYAGASAIYNARISAGAAVHTDLSGAAYTATPNDWTSCLLGGIPILNNGTDDPQRWDLNLANNFQDLDNWPANTTCKVLRSYKQFLVALGVTKSGTEYPFMVKWSNPADPGAVPTTWDETDTTNDAGEVDLAEGYDPIVDGLQLRDSFIIYKEASVWRMDFTGGPFVFKFSKVLGTSGALNRNCIVELDGVHFVLTGSDVITHDGNQPTSVLDKQVRRFLFQDMDIDALDKAFVFKNPFFNEVYACYASIGSDYPNKAMVWNYRDQTVSFREMPDVYHANFGPVSNDLASTWDSDSDPWDSDLTLWDGPGNVPDRTRVLMASNDPNLFLLDASSTFDGAAVESHIERRGMSFGEAEQRVLITGIRPRITGSNGNTVKVSVGYSDDDPYADPTYGTAVDHTIGETIRNDFLVSGRYIAVKFESGTALQWRLDSFDIEYELEGQW